jgi:hypothetical protein
MRRTLIAIGCDAYDNLTPLAGAENDAQRVFDAMLPEQTGDYDRASSFVIRSPTVQDLRDALRASLFDAPGIETLTIFFAGHGAVGPGSYYMALRDTRPDALSATALSLAELLRMIAEAAPAQTYLIIDACEAGGLVADLNAILKSELLGRSGTPGLSLLAMAASDEGALEAGGEGVGTTALLDCISGKTFLHGSRPTLDLVEIGRSVSERVQRAGLQSPVVWGLNLAGLATFCRNPHAGTGNAPLRDLLAAWADPETEEIIRAALPRFWETYVTLPSRWDPRVFLDYLSPILADLSAKPAALVAFSQRIAESFGARAAESVDPFREIELKTAVTVALLPYSDSPEIEAFLTEQCAILARDVVAALDEAIEALTTDRFALLHGGLSDLYYLPIRVTRLLGWAGFVAHADAAGSSDSADVRARLETIFDQILEHYGLTLVAMSDTQAPALAMAVTGAVAQDLSEQAETLVSSMFASLVDCGGRPSRPDLEPTKVLSYLIARGEHALDQVLDLVAQPTELGAVILMSSRLVGLEDTFDHSLHEIDHVPLNAFIATDYRQFGNEVIESGGNATYLVGHDFWTIEELAALWPSVRAPMSRSVRLTVALASPVFPDRCAWFLFGSTELPPDRNKGESTGAVAES